MAKIGELTVEVRLVLTISDTTAETLLGLLQMYCEEKGYAITTVTSENKEGEIKPLLDFEPIIEEVNATEEEAAEREVE